MLHLTLTNLVNPWDRKYYTHIFLKKKKDVFTARIKDETQLLKTKLERGDFSSMKPVGDFEVEAWLVNELCRPAAINNEFFEKFNNPMATPELAKFNIELNNTPLSVKGDCFHQFEEELESVFNDASKVAKELGAMS